MAKHEQSDVVLAGEPLGDATVGAGGLLSNTAVWKDELPVNVAAWVASLPKNTAAWMELLPAEVVVATGELLNRVAEMRQTETIYPTQENVLNALAHTAPADVRVVILGQDPYHEPGQAIGLSFSVPEGCKLPPSLRNIYKELVADLSSDDSGNHDSAGIDGCDSADFEGDGLNDLSQPKQTAFDFGYPAKSVAPMPASGDLTSWADQGVLLLNTTLTVREGEANSHVKLGWQTLTHAVIRQCMQLPQPVVFLAWGRHAIDLVEDAREIVANDAHEAIGVHASAIATGGTQSVDDGVSNVVSQKELPAHGAVLGPKLVLKSSHPSPLSANRAAKTFPSFMGSRPFSQANAFLEANGCAPIDWMSVR